MSRAVILVTVLSVLAVAGHPAAAQRQPDRVGPQLTAICEKAGYGRNRLGDCGGAFEKLCRKAGLDPKSERCWRHLLDQDDRKSLDYNGLRVQR